MQAPFGVLTLSDSSPSQSNHVSKPRINTQSLSKTRNQTCDEVFKSNQADQVRVAPQSSKYEALSSRGHIRTCLVNIRTNISDRPFRLFVLNNSYLADKDETLASFTMHHSNDQEWQASTAKTEELLIYVAIKLVADSLFTNYLNSKIEFATKKVSHQPVLAQSCKSVSTQM